MKFILCTIIVLILSVYFVQNSFQVFRRAYRETRFIVKEPFATYDEIDLSKPTYEPKKLTVDNQ